MEILDRTEIVKKLISEKGTGCINQLFYLLEKNEEDSGLAEIIFEAVSGIGEEAYSYVREYIEERVGGEISPTVLAVVVDIFGDLAKKSDESFLVSLLPFFDMEEHQLFVYEALAKIGAGKQFLDLFEFMLFEDFFKESLSDHIIMILANIPEKKTFDILNRLFSESCIKEEQKELIIDSCRHMFFINSVLESILEIDSTNSLLTAISEREGKNG